MIAAFSPIFSFLGGAAFRYALGQIVGYFDKKQEHKQELERMSLSATLEDKAHARQMENLRLQAELGVRQVQVQGDYDLAKIDAMAFAGAMEQAQKPTGIRWVDAWNACIRPAGASVSIALWLLSLVQRGFVLTPFDMDLMCSVLGYFYADRNLGRRGK